MTQKIYKKKMAHFKLYNSCNDSNLYFYDHK